MKVLLFSDYFLYFCPRKALPTMEKLIHYVWKHKLFPLAQLATTDGQSVEVIDVGLPNSNAGPDFFNAKVRTMRIFFSLEQWQVPVSNWLKMGNPYNYYSAPRQPYRDFIIRLGIKWDIFS